jgi:hypothetical protein
MRFRHNILDSLGFSVRFTRSNPPHPNSPVYPFLQKLQLCLVLITFCNLNRRAPVRSCDPVRSTIDFRIGVIFLNVLEFALRFGRYGPYENRY